MLKKQAMIGAQKVADREGLRMVVTFDPYAENGDTSQNYGYFPARATGIFMLEEKVETIDPKKCVDCPAADKSGALEVCDFGTRGRCEK